MRLDICEFLGITTEIIFSIPDKENFLKAGSTLTSFEYNNTNQLRGSDFEEESKIIQIILNSKTQEFNIATPEINYSRLEKLFQEELLGFDYKLECVSYSKHPDDLLKDIYIALKVNNIYEISTIPGFISETFSSAIKYLEIEEQISHVTEN